MAKYSLSNSMAGTQQTLTTTYKTVWDITSLTGATTLRRAWIYDVMFDADGAPADNTVVYVINRQTTTGTRTTATPAPLDAGDAAALITCGVNTTVEPTITASTQLIERAINQKSSYRWCTIPGSGAELVVPAITTNGIGARAKGLSSGYAGTVLAQCHFYE